MDDLNADIEDALDTVLPEAKGDEDTELHQRLRALITNCLEDNYDHTDVRAVIELAIQPAEEE